MKIGPRYKICKRLGSSVFEKCQTQKFMLSEARSGSTRKKKGGFRGRSDYGSQLLEKQKARLTYGLTEKQFSKYVKEAMEKSGEDSSIGLTTKLETRLDNVAFRFGFAKTRRQARQLVSHGHITVGGRKVTIPSYHVQQGDEVAVRTESRESPLFLAAKEGALERVLPTWLRVKEGDALSGVVKELPRLSEPERSFNPAVVIQFYSR